MSVAHAPPAHVHRLHVNPWLVAVIALAAALVALGSWVLIDRYGGAESDPATALVDDLYAAATARDPDAFASLLTADAVLEDGAGDRVSAAEAVQGIAQFPATVERVAPVTVEGDFAATYVRDTMREERGLLSEGETITTLVVFQLRDGKIARMWEFLPGVTKPFDNAKLPALGNTLTP